MSDYPVPDAKVFEAFHNGEAWFEDENGEEQCMEADELPWVIIEQSQRWENVQMDYGSADDVHTFIIQHKDGGPFFKGHSTYRSWGESDSVLVGEVKKVEVTKFEWLLADFVDAE